MPTDGPRSQSDERRPPRPRGWRRAASPPTEEQELRIVTAVRAGSMRGTAARAAGVREATFNEWLARGRGEHRSLRPTPRLRALARAVDQAAAEARVGAEIRVYRDSPRFWLTRAARSAPDSDGWTTPRKEDSRQQTGDTLEDRIREWDRMHAIKERDQHRASCDGCPSFLHHRRYDDDNDCDWPARSGLERWAS